MILLGLGSWYIFYQTANTVISEQPASQSEAAEMFGGGESIFPASTTSLTLALDNQCDASTY